jgi:hypothetical protein
LSAKIHKKCEKQYVKEFFSVQHYGLLAILPHGHVCAPAVMVATQSRQPQKRVKKNFFILVNHLED